MKALHIITFLLLTVGGINWGLVGFFEFNLVAYLFGDMTLISRIVYSLVGISALIEIIIHPKNCRMCKEKNTNI